MSNFGYFSLRCFVTETSVIRFLFPCHCGGGGGGGGGEDAI